MNKERQTDFMVVQVPTVYIIKECTKIYTFNFVYLLNRVVGNKENMLEIGLPTSLNLNLYD